MSLTLQDLRYLLRLVQGDMRDATYQQSLRIEGTLAEMIGRTRHKDRIVDANMSTTNPMDTRTVVHPNGPMTEPWLLTIHRSKGGETMAGKKKSAAKPSKPVGKMKKK